MLYEKRKISDKIYKVMLERRNLWKNGHLRYIYLQNFISVIIEDRQISILSSKNLLVNFMVY